MTFLSVQASAPSEKAEQATCAEILSGLMAAGWAPENSTMQVWPVTLIAQAMAGATLEMSESWSVASRYERTETKGNQ